MPTADMWSDTRTRRAIVWGSTASVLGAGLGLGFYFGFEKHVLEDNIATPNVDWDAFMAWLKQWLLDHGGSPPGTGQPPQTPDSGSMSTQAVSHGTSSHQDASHWLDVFPVEAWVLTAVVTLLAAAAYAYHTSNSTSRTPARAAGMTPS